VSALTGKSGDAEFYLHLTIFCCPKRLSSGLAQ